MGAVDIVKTLNKLGGENGIGIADLVENRLVGMKSRGVYETPGGTILYRAHQVLETITLDRDTQHYKELVASKFAELVYFGQWFTPLREALSAFVDKTQENVTGDVTLKLYKGNMINAGVVSPSSLYSEEIATFDEDHVYDQKDSAGFINLFGLPIKVAAKARMTKTNNPYTITGIPFGVPPHIGIKAVSKPLIKRKGTVIKHGKNVGGQILKSSRQHCRRFQLLPAR